MNKTEKIIVGLDIGTSKVCAVGGLCGADGSVEIIGVGQSPSFNQREGVDGNSEDTATAIRTAIDEVERMAGCIIDDVVVGIADNSICSQCTSVTMPVNQDEIGEQDILRSIELARRKAISPGRKILHIIPYEFVVNGQEGIISPVGMSCSHFEARVDVVTASSASVSDIVKVCNRAGLNVTSLVLQSLASAEAVLDANEKEAGVAVIDIGSNTTEVTVCADNAVRYIVRIPLAGNHLSNDLASGLGMTMNEAESVKRLHGCCCLEQMADKNEIIQIAVPGTSVKREVSRLKVANILQTRTTEILSLANNELKNSSHKGDLVAGVVITGGTAQMFGVVDLAEQIFDMPVRAGSPRNIQGFPDKVCQPSYSTAVGLVLYAAGPGYQNSGKAGRFGFRGMQAVKRIWKEFF